MNRRYFGLYGSQAGIPRALPLLVVAALLAVTLPGCSGCRKQSSQADKKQAEDDAQDKKKKTPKDPFEIGRLNVLPADESLATNDVKPGHFVSTIQQMKANDYNFPGELVTTTVDTAQRPINIKFTDFYIVMNRHASLPKGQNKFFEATYFVPRIEGRGRDGSVPRTWLQSRLRSRRGGSEVSASQQPTTRMAGYQYYFLVLSDDPDSYGFVKKLDSVSPPMDELSGDERILFYRVSLPKIDQRVPLPSHPFAWSSIAYVLWDGINPNILSRDQQQAMLDWLHWGGQLIISGPDSLPSLRGSFLDAYLPADMSRTTELTAADLAELNAYWSMEVTGNPKKNGKHLLELREGQTLLGVDLRLRDESNYLSGTGSLVAERRLGVGRVVTTAFSLNDRRVVNWGSFDAGGFDGFFNGGLLRRPRRLYFLKDRDFGMPQSRWADYPEGSVTDACLTSSVRYFARDIGLSPSKDGNDWRYSGFRDWPESGVGGWNDESGTAVASRTALRDAAGISIPKAGFVFRVVAVYLIILVPVNWIAFRAIGRVEWAWAAAPLIAIIGAVAVVKLAQLDIGFARSRTEIAVLEIQGGYHRAHLTRYTALYTSLSTSYALTFDDDSAVAQPFYSDKREPEESQPITVSRDNQVHMTGFQVDSNRTGMLHSEQMYDMGNTVRLVGNASAGFQVANGTDLHLRGVGVIRKNEQGQFETAWVDELRPRTNVTLDFQSAEGGRPRLKQWNSSPMTFGYDAEVTTVFARCDANGDGRIRREELPSDHAALVQFDRWDENGDAQLDRAELISWCRSERSGKISIGSLIDVATEQLQLRTGDVRLIGWTDQDVPGLSIYPAASQQERGLLVVAHLARGGLPDPQPDVNTRADVSSDFPDDTTEMERDEILSQ